MAQAPVQPRVLSIQSHVVHGYVGAAIFHCRLTTCNVVGKQDPSEAGHRGLLVCAGNKCAVFPLQLLGFDVDAVRLSHALWSMS